ncbi:hypothetical protein [uncultured Microbacterium sp.]|uniref:hypothetical protein n=1 Tax=uncultured Microbacterium sp. TaxID=191216 RepID=UPI002594944F|nr:hypothetical protein [uncultured Microbacterium sp.]
MTKTTANLRFRLPGQWYRIDPNADDEALVHARIDEIVRDAVGVADDAAVIRRRMRDGLRDAATAARAASAEVLLLCREVAPGVPTPISLSVHAPITITPSIGTSAEQVMRAFELSLPHTSEPDLDSAQRIELADALVLRQHVITPQQIEEGGESIVQNRLDARYWYTVPDAKQVTLVHMTSPLGEIPHAMLRFFDAIVAASSWAVAEAGVERR